MMQAQEVARERVLVIHNAYQHRGGEDTVVEAEMALLRERGHAVELFSAHNDSINGMGRLALAGRTLWSRAAAADMDTLITRFAPDVIHVHNTFPLLSPAIYWAAAARRVPVVQTLHNFRLLCPQAMFLREGRVCEDCLGHLPWRGVARGCYRGSRAQTAVLAGMVSAHRAIGTWQNKVTRYIALNAFCRDKFIAGGLPAERVVIKPNFVDFDRPEAQARSGFLFVGRLSAEKGVRVLADAAAAVDGAQVTVAGSGPEAPVLEGIAGVDAKGSVDRSAVARMMASATALLVPSVWYETFGLVIVEAFAAATPVIASRLGVMPDLVEDGATGLLFEPGNAADLASKMRWAQANPERMAEMGAAARARYEARYTAERNYTQLIDIYRDAMAAARTEAGHGAH
ncbi:MAG: glycosyltransferase [Rhodocyclaceae bacterium]|nr:glycosyltransferase [Rhodocyclaceae bacterium]